MSDQYSINPEKGLRIGLEIELEIGAYFPSAFFMHLCLKVCSPKGRKEAFVLLRNFGFNSVLRFY